MMLLTVILKASFPCYSPSSSAYSHIDAQGHKASVEGAATLIDRCPILSVLQGQPWLSRSQAAQTSPEMRVLSCTSSGLGRSVPISSKPLDLIIALLFNLWLIIWTRWLRLVTPMVEEGGCHEFGASLGFNYTPSHTLLDISHNHSLTSNSLMLHLPHVVCLQDVWPQNVAN